MRDNKEAALEYWEAYTKGDVSTILKIVDSVAKIQAGQQDWASAPMILPNLLGASGGNKYEMHQIFSNDDATKFIIHFHVFTPNGLKSEQFKVIEFGLYGKITAIRLVTND